MIPVALDNSSEDALCFRNRLLTQAVIGGAGFGQTLRRGCRRASYAT